MGKRILTATLCYISFLGVILYPTSHALAAVADYEYRSVCPSPSGGRYSSADIDRWNFYKCECTSYAAQMINKQGVYFHNQMKSASASSSYYQDRWSHARYWKAKAISLGYTVSSTPVPGAIAWWGAASWNSNYGHVAHVDSVTNGKANISEYNYSPHYGFGTRKGVVADAYIIFGGSQSKSVAPTGLSASASGTSIALRWTDTSSNESGFRVYRWNGSAWGSLATTGANAISYTNSSLSSNTTYYYTVCSYNSAGESCAANYVSATTGSSGSVPGSVSVNPASGSWTSNQNLAVTSAGATSMYYTMVNTYDGSTPSDPSSPSASSNNGSLSGSSATFQLYGSSGQLKKSKLRFVGCNSYGCGAVSGVYSYSIDQRSTVSKPAAPGSLSAVAASSSSINLRWSDLSSNESGFRPYRWNGSSWASLDSVSANSTSYTNSGLSSNTTYYYYVCSYNSAGESCPANYVQATTSSASGGSSWDGKSPSGTSCEQDATTVASRSNSYGKVELRWSNTCKTNWTRVVPNSSSYSTSGKIRRTSDGRSYTTSGTGTRFTEMVYAPTVQACASGSIKGYTLSEVCR